MSKRAPAERAGLLWESRGYLSDSRDRPARTTNSSRAPTNGLIRSAGRPSRPLPCPASSPAGRGLSNANPPTSRNSVIWPRRRPTAPPLMRFARCSHSAPAMAAVMPVKSERFDSRLTPPCIPAPQGGVSIGSTTDPRRNRNGFVWKYRDGGATAQTLIGTYHIEPDPPGVAARFQRGDEVQLLGVYSASAAERQRCEMHHLEMQDHLNPPHRLA
jgi:hypothetical protein